MELNPVSSCMSLMELTISRGVAKLCGVNVANSKFKILFYPDIFLGGSTIFYCETALNVH